MKKGNIVTQFKKFYAVLPREYRLKFYLVILSVLFMSVLELFSIIAVVPLITMLTNPLVLEEYPAINYFYTLSGVENLKHFTLLVAFSIFILFIIKNAVVIYLMKFQSSFSYNLSRDISLRQYLNYYGKGFEFISSRNSTVLVRDVFNMAMNFANGITNSFIMFLSEAVVLSLIAVGLFLYKPMLMLGIVVILLPTFFILYKIIKKKLSKVELELIEIGPKINEYLFNSFLGYIDVKLFGKEEYFMKRYSALMQRFSDLNVSKNVLRNITPKMFEVIIFMAVFFIVAYGILIADNTAMIVEVLGVFALSAYKLIPSLNKIFAAVVSLKSYEYIYDYFKELKAVEAEIPKSEENSSINFENEIKLEDISYSYDKKQNVLNNINLTIKKGEYIGIIGKSGSGKTTLIKLLLRFLKEDQGLISIDGIPIQEENKPAWRKIIGYVPQQSYIIDGTLIDNIAFGVNKKDVDIEKIKQIIKLCSLDDLIKQSEEGLEQNIGEGGNKISGGQKQRVAIARALYRDVKVLILDEATSSLDNDTEKEIMNTVSQLLKNNKITVISIAHRYSSLRECDRIIKVERGELKGEVTYEELSKGVA